MSDFWISMDICCLCGTEQRLQIKRAVLFGVHGSFSPDRLVIQTDEKFGFEPTAKLLVPAPREEFEAALDRLKTYIRLMDHDNVLRMIHELSEMHAAAIERAEGVTHTCKEQAKLITQIDAERTALRAEVAARSQDIQALRAQVEMHKTKLAALTERTERAEVARDTWRRACEEMFPAETQRKLEAERDALRAAMNDLIHSHVGPPECSCRACLAARAALAGNEDKRA